MSDWSSFRKEHKRMIEKSRIENIDDILALDFYGYTVIEITPYHFRINGIMDLFPMSMKYHFIPTKKRGFYPKDVMKFLISNNINPQ